MGREGFGRAVGIGAMLIAIVCGAAVRSSTQPVFRAGVDVVQADAMVLDADGSQATGLTGADFTLSVDGQPRVIEWVDYIAEGPAAAVPPGRATPTPPTASPIARTLPADRHIVFVVDEGSIGAGRGRSAIRAAGRMLDRFGPRDRLALLSVPSGPSVDFTSEREPIRAALSRVVGHNSFPSSDDFRLSLTDVFAFDVGATTGDRAAQEAVLQRECPPGAPARELCVHSLLTDAQGRAEAIRERTRNTVAALDRLVQSLGKMSGPKIVVLVSEGLLLRPDRRDDALVTSLGARAAVAGVKVFVMLLDGSVIDAADTGGRERAPSQTLSQDRSIEEDGLRALTAASGGVLMRVTGNGDGAIERLARALSGYYVLGFRVQPADREGSHTIAIRAARPGLNVVARTQFAIPAAARRPANTERAAVVRAPRRRESVSSVSLDKVRLRVATHSVADSDGTVRILLSIDVQDPAAQPVTALALGYKLTVGDRVVADTGRVVPVIRDAAGGAQPISYIAFRNIAPGRYNLQLSASDGTKHSAFVTHAVDATLHRAGPHTLGDLLLAPSASGDDGPFAVPADVIVDTRLIAGVDVTVADTASLADVVVRFEIANATGAIVQGGRELPLRPAGPLSQFARATLDTAALPAGDYVARASIVTAGVVNGSVDAAFRVAR